jgi:hypothetical protein
MQPRSLVAMLAALAAGACTTIAPSAGEAPAGLIDASHSYGWSDFADPDGVIPTSFERVQPPAR